MYRYSLKHEWTTGNVGHKTQNDDKQNKTRHRTMTNKTKQDTEN